MREMLPLLVKPSGSLSVAYSNCNKLAQIGLPLPIATADCERAFSTMRRVKSRLRSEMSVHISIEGPCMKEFDFNTLLETWSSLKNRRTF